MSSLFSPTRDFGTAGSSPYVVPKIFSTAHVFEKSFTHSNGVFGFPCTPFPSTTDAVSRAGLGATTPLQKRTSCRSSSKAFASEITLTETAQQQRTGWSQHHLPTGWSQHHLPMCILHPARTAVVEGYTPFAAAAAAAAAQRALTRAAGGARSGWHPKSRGVIHTTTRLQQLSALSLDVLFLKT